MFISQFLHFHGGKNLNKKILNHLKQMMVFIDAFVLFVCWKLFLLTSLCFVEEIKIIRNGVVVVWRGLI